MKTTIGGDRLGSGNKQEISMRNYERSTHDLSEAWRSSMASGTLVPFLKKVALPGDSFDIDLFCEVLTLPTIGPLFGSYKVQLDVFQVPVRLYHSALHMNMLGIGLEMQNINLPKIQVAVKNDSGNNDLSDNAQVNASCILKYLGISGIGTIDPSVVGVSTYRRFNALPWLGYWDIYKNYYANKQEERGFGIHTSTTTLLNRQEIIGAKYYDEEEYIGDALEQTVTPSAGTQAKQIILQFKEDAVQPVFENVYIIVGGGVPEPITDVFETIVWNPNDNTLGMLTNTDTGGSVTWQINYQEPFPAVNFKDISPSLTEFPLSNIDDMREHILQATKYAEVVVNSQIDPVLEPYAWVGEYVEDVGTADLIDYSITYSQEGLAVKTYQSDLFNNWISTEWIDGENGINAVTAVDTTGDSFTIDALNLANKVYVMLNRIAISGGSYDDWLDAVYTHNRVKSIESPMYLGSLIKELAFEEVISTGATSGSGENEQPLGTLAGRGVLTDKHKGGKIRVKIDEPSYILGIVSLTPRIDYSQGNDWDMNLETMNDFHKPALDAIGFQDLITDQMAWQDTVVEGGNDKVFKSAGKQPAWINYMTSVNKTYGNFAEQNKDMFMTLNRRYDIDPINGGIEDLTTYIDPTKFNHIFAQTDITAQNFWVQIGSRITARRKMSAKIIPNL